MALPPCARAVDDGPWGRGATPTSAAPGGVVQHAIVLFLGGMALTGAGYVEEEGMDKLRHGL